MQFLILNIGKTKDKNISAAIEHYCRSISNMAKLEYLELRDVNSQPHKETEVIQKFFEQRKLLNRPKHQVICLDEKGKEQDSVSFATQLQQWQDQGINQVSAIIGGAHGFDSAFRTWMQSAYWLSLSKMTLPHELARLVFCEQLYRVLHIHRGSKYHHC